MDSSMTDLLSLKLVIFNFILMIIVYTHLFSDGISVDIEKVVDLKKFF